MRYSIATLTVFFLICMIVTTAQAQDGWRAAKKATPEVRRTKVSAPVRLTSYQREVPEDGSRASNGPLSSELKTAQLQAPLKSETKNDVTVPAGTQTTTTYTQPAPQTVYYAPGTQTGYANNCFCPPQTQPVYSTYYAPGNPQTYVPVSGTSYTTFRPLLNLTPAPQQQYVGQGIFGQPKVYVPGQPILNVLRYISP